MAVENLTAGTAGDRIARLNPRVDWASNVRLAMRDYNLPPHLVVIEAVGDSMRPTFGDGDSLLIDTSVQSVHSEGIYVFRVGGEGFIKRLQRVPGEGLRVLSDHPSYRTWTVTPGMDFAVFGRVLKVWRCDDY